jgi:hypothetical protein
VAKEKEKTVHVNVSWNEESESHAYKPDVTTLTLVVGNVYITVDTDRMTIVERAAQYNSVFNHPQTVLTIPLTR